MTKDWNGNGKSTFITIGASNHTDKEREETISTLRALLRLTDLSATSSCRRRFGSALVVLDACQSVLLSSGTMS